MLVTLASWVLLLWSGTSLAATPEPISPPETPIPADTLGVATPITDPGGHALDNFYAALRETQQGKRKTRVVFYGASHMAGDAFTRVIRHRLQGLFGDAGPGFVVPAYPWHNYNHRDLNIDYSKGWSSYFVSRSHNHADRLYGLAGCSFESEDRKDFCRIETARRSAYGRSISQVELYYWKQKGGGDLEVVIDGKREEYVPTGAEADGPGYAKYELPDGKHTVELRPRGNGPVMLFGTALERDTAGVVVDAMGINGARASAQLRWDPRLFAEHLTRRDPDLIVLAYGTNATGDDNDPIEAYEERLDRVVRRVRSLVPRASCVYVGPSDRPIKVEPEEAGKGKRKRSRRRRGKDDDEPKLKFLPRPRQAEVIAAQRRVAHRHGCGYWDWNAMMGGTLSMVKWVHAEPRMGARDYVHHTRRGYERAASLFWDALMSGYEEPREAQ